MKATTTPVSGVQPCEYSRAYDAQSRRTGIASGDYAASVGYANGKASTLGWQERTTSYTYRPGLNQLSGFTTEGTSTARAFEYDAQHRLTEIKLNGQLSTGYTLNEKDQRIRVESEDGSYWKFRYDGKSQVTAMERRRAGEEEQVTPGLYYGGFSYDDIGNWTETSRTGNTYYYLTSNILNQYTDVSTVWPMNTWNPTYDVDGNMLTGIIGWSYGWNGENRLISAENGDTRLEFSYDYMGRRFEKKVYTANVLTKHEKFVYDGYKLIQVLDALNDNAVTMTFVWHPESTGLDTPFSMTYDGETYYYVTDGNKNVTALLDADGNRAAEYIYHPFGTIYSKTGPMVDLNPFRFSSEYHDDETGLVYYNYRYYSPELGRWISRDPIEEEGGVNLYAMVGNCTTQSWDILGLDWIIERDKQQEWATATRTSLADGVDKLASKAFLSESEVLAWLKNVNLSPVIQDDLNSKRCFKIPNTFVVAIGEGTIAGPVLTYWAMQVTKALEKKNILVKHFNSIALVGAQEMRETIKADNNLGYAFLGHGNKVLTSWYDWSANPKFKGINGAFVFIDDPAYYFLAIDLKRNFKYALGINYHCYADLQDWKSLSIKYYGSIGSLSALSGTRGIGYWGGWNGLVNTAFGE